MNAIEIDYLAVGEDSRSGDAIAMRFGDYENAKWKSQSVIIIDGGNAKSGEALIKHVSEVYKTDHIDRVILSHPDGDHASGLRNVIEELKVGKIWMHRPWNHWDDLKDSIADGRITKKSFDNTLKEAYQFAYDIEQLAVKKKITIVAPHQGLSFTVNDLPVLKVLSPGKDFYLDLIRQSQKTPEMTTNEIVAQKTFSSEKKSVQEDMTFETENLTEKDGVTSSENDMSLVLHMNVAGTQALFTGDVGTMGMYKALEYAVANKIDLKTLDLFHVPHHGSRHNLSKGILLYIKSKYAVISCAPKGAPSHPSPIVTNALIRRSFVPYCTKGKLLSYHNDIVPSRPNVVKAVPLPFENYVEIPK